MEKNKFDDWSEVKDCNQCEPYWNNQCDGVKVGSEKRCTAFLATRKVDIPVELEALRKAVKWLRISGFLVNLVVVLHLIGHILGWE